MMFTKRRIAEAVLLQRTNLQKLPSIVPRGTHPLWYKQIVAIESFLRANKILDLYSREMKSEWDSIEPYLPSYRDVLDIGCGIGGIHTFHVNSPEIWLADKDGKSENLYYQYEAKASHYNSLEVTGVYLTDICKVPKERLHLVDVAKSPLPDKQFDFILSLLSWGFHYPIEDYLDYVVTHLTDSGVVVVDCRTGTKGLELLRSHFAVTVIVTKDGYSRVVCRKR